MKELERELNVWKIAHKAADDDKNTLKKNVSRLERSIGSLKVRHLSSFHKYSLWHLIKRNSLRMIIPSFSASSTAMETYSPLN